MREEGGGEGDELKVKFPNKKNSMKGIIMND